MEHVPVLPMSPIYVSGARRIMGVAHGWSQNSHPAPLHAPFILPAECGRCGKGVAATVRFTGDRRTPSA